MSVSNIAFLPDRILCLTDTLQYRERKPCGFGRRKCDVAPSGRYALVTRGLVSWGDRLADYVLQEGEIDGAEVRAEAYFRHVLELAFENDPDLSVEATILGWSDLHQSMRGVRFLLNRRPMTVEVLSPGWHIAPKHPRFTVPSAVRPDIDAGRMVKVALAQQMALNGLHDFNECIGGCMHLTTITREGATQEMIGLYPDYDQHAAEFVDPNADAVAAFRGAVKVAA